MSIMYDLDHLVDAEQISEIKRVPASVLTKYLDDWEYPFDPYDEPYDVDGAHERFRDGFVPGSPVLVFSRDEDERPQNFDFNLRPSDLIRSLARSTLRGPVPIGLPRGGTSLTVPVVITAVQSIHHSFAWADVNDYQANGYILDVAEQPKVHIALFRYETNGEMPPLLDDRVSELSWQILPDEPGDEWTLVYMETTKISSKV